MTRFLVFLLVLATSGILDAADEVVPLQRAHAHNDYRHEVPLGDALQHGFCNVEADLFLVEGEMLVGHDRNELKPARTLEALYLKPLATRVAQNAGRVYREGPGFTLMIDFKNDGQATYRALRKLLDRYTSMLTKVENGKVHPGSVTIVISGDRPQADIAAQQIRYVGIDGRLSDLESSLPAHLMPWISDRWGAHFRWRGTGAISAAEKQKLEKIVQQTHAAGRRVRFWAIPDTPAAWEVVYDAGVDLINTDDLPGLQAFLLERQPREPD